MTPTFSGEIQLAGWSDTHNGGAKITFWLPDADNLEVFKGLTAKKGNTAGHRFACVLVEIGDDDLPVTQSAQSETIVDHLVDANKTITKGGALAKLAGQWCQSQSFFDWIRPVYDRMLGGDGDGTGDIYIAKDGDIPTVALFCKHAILLICDIRSRAELDHDPVAAEKFHRLIRTPYSEYLKDPV